MDSLFIQQFIETFSDCSVQAKLFMFKEKVNSPTKSSNDFLHLANSHDVTLYIEDFTTKIRDSSVLLSSTIVTNSGCLIVKLLPAANMLFAMQSACHTAGYASGQCKNVLEHY